MTVASACVLLRSARACRASRPRHIVAAQPICVHGRAFEQGEHTMLGIILLVILLLLLVGALPAWPHSRDWGYFPSGGLGLLLIIILILVIARVI